MKKTVIQVLAVLWLAALLRLTVFRDGCFSHGLFSGRMEWDAFAYYAKLARVGNWRYFTYLFVGNLVWFAPVGVLVSAGREPVPYGRERTAECRPCCGRRFLAFCSPWALSRCSIFWAPGSRSWTI